ncbi:hypothetical protein Nepgr_014664 [Nepenthes gracilis]|uniref:Uncharacterized protein n=1 Tax=Nepenthes gracilis TaxID=150966 RepID=A0AAD3XQ23_NEPGR|nr:hypothetical protein Nepgr_014664 [Nepenthes gracilis]
MQSLLELVLRQSSHVQQVSLMWKGSASISVVEGVEYGLMCPLSEIKLAGFLTEMKENSVPLNEFPWWELRKKRMLMVRDPYIMESEEV